ncbi:hypothetical protein NQ315_016994 [Exocentrus adspersus]|uniref:C2H2-type domain-containing protein n=1 Tax=Exocentrus adspersus TaxID=1586481 RepID=A0AAV8VBA2_9CUCU|nr:hypothetical protein NQ315_016994 [Exocentrus adspersus]
MEEDAVIRRQIKIQKHDAVEAEDDDLMYGVKESQVKKLSYRDADIEKQEGPAFEFVNVETLELTKEDYKIYPENGASYAEIDKSETKPIVDKPMEGATEVASEPKDLNTNLSTSSIVDSADLSAHPLDFEWYKSGSCNFKSEYSTCFKGYVSMPKDASQIHCFRCNLCSYTTDQEDSLETHTSVHKDRSCTKWFKCDSCDFQSKQRTSLTAHVLIHTDLSKIKWFKCRQCDFQSRHRTSLKCHVSIHKDPSEVKWFKCDFCDFQSRYKSSLTAHVLLHRDPSEAKWFECRLCGFKTRRNYYLKQHMLKH